MLKTKKSYIFAASFFFTVLVVYTASASVESKNLFKEIAFYQVFGKPLIMYSGITTLLSFVFTASIAVLNRRGIKAVPFVWHKRMAVISLAFGLMHGMLGILANL